MFVHKKLLSAVLLSAALTFSISLSAQHYTRTDLTQNAAGISNAPNTDPSLVNAWGLARAAGSPWWVSDNGTGLSTLYNADGVQQALVVTMTHPDTVSSSAPTGAVFNYAAGFEAAAGKNPTVALVRVNNNGHAVYKGCALAGPTASSWLYATNFKTGKIDVWDNQFHPVNLGSNAFLLGADQGGDASGQSGDIRQDLVWAPFNIQNVGGNLVVTFARKAPGATDETAGPGFGRVVIFDASGRKIRELQTGTFLNAPWGVALAPADFGAFSHRLLIGNFGDGTIHAFNAVSGKFEGTLLGAGGAPITIDGLWALSFGGGTVNNGLANSLYFTSGPHDESAGVFGRLSPTAAEQRGNAE